MKAIVFGLVAGAIGAAVWAAIAVTFGYEIGWIAWGVGGLVGWAVAQANREGARSSTAAGALAVGITVLSIVAGKYVASQQLVPSDEEIVAMFVEGFDNEEYVMSFLADDVVEEFESEGRVVEWPEGVDPGNASTEGEYPSDVWTEAAARWAALGDAGRASFRADREAEVRTNVSENLPAIRAAFGGGGFLASFGAMDLLFFGLAVVTAFGVGSGRKNQEAIATEYVATFRGLLIRTVAADGIVDDREVAAAVRVLQERVGIEATEADIRSAAESPMLVGDPVAGLPELAAHLTDEGKQGIVRAVVEVAMADGTIAPEERALVEAIAESVGMSAEDLHSVLGQMVTPA